MYCYPPHFFGLTKTHLETKQTKKINSCFVLVFYWGKKPFYSPFHLNQKFTGMIDYFCH